MILNPPLLYSLLGLGAIGVCLALPRPRVSPQLIGGLISAIAFGGIFIMLGRSDEASRPGPYFYIFALISILSALRVISHPRPVYAALYFIFTILSSSVLYLLLQAEFMAFALIIIYAGAILITYLFVIMLATQAPTEDQTEALSEYDSFSREPLVATALGFVLLAVLTTMIAKGLPELGSRNAGTDPRAELVKMPRRIIDELDKRGAFEVFERPLPADVANLINEKQFSVTLSFDRANAPRLLEKLEDPAFRPLLGTEADIQKLRSAFAREEAYAKARTPELAKAIREAFGNKGANGAEPGVTAEQAAKEARLTVVPVFLPPDAAPDNIESVGFALVAEHPMALELAGIILLMAMLGAVVLARKHVEMSEAEKAAAARALVMPGPRGYGGDA